MLKPSVEALAGPGLNNAPLFTLHEGTVVTIQGERDGWLRSESTASANDSAAAARQDRRRETMCSTL